MQFSSALFKGGCLDNLCFFSTVLRARYRIPLKFSRNKRGPRPGLTILGWEQCADIFLYRVTVPLLLVHTALKTFSGQTLKGRSHCYISLLRLFVCRDINI